MTEPNPTTPSPTSYSGAADPSEALSHEHYEKPIGLSAVDDEIDMTPMVDVTFLLLIFFMITAAFAMQAALLIPPVREDEAASSNLTFEDLERQSVVVRVDGDNVFWIGAPLWQDEQRAPSIASMRDLVREAREGSGGSPGPNRMLVQAHGDATHEFVVAALDSGSLAGMQEVQLAKYEDGEL